MSFKDVPVRARLWAQADLVNRFFYKHFARSFLSNLIIDAYEKGYHYPEYGVGRYGYGIMWPGSEESSSQEFHLRRFHYLFPYIYGCGPSV